MELQDFKDLVLTLLANGMDHGPPNRELDTTEISIDCGEPRGPKAPQWRSAISQALDALVEDGTIVRRISDMDGNMVAVYSVPAAVAA